MTVLLKNAMQPNLVQTLENNPCLSYHGGPFANDRPMGSWQLCPSRRTNALETGRLRW